MPVFGIPESKLWGIISAGFGIITIALVTFWAQENPMTSIYSKTGYLGVPNWTDNRISFHIVLMVGGFFGSQIFGAIIWVFVSSKLWAQLIHIFFESFGLITMAIGLLAAVYDKNITNTPHLTSMHSLYGIFCIAIYSITYIYGFLLGMIPAYFPRFELKLMTKLRSFHGLLGQIAFYLSILSIVTGIMEQLTITGCEYVGLTLTAPDINPGANYYAIPDACKVGNGLGIFAVLATLTTLLTIHYRKVVTINKLPTALGNKRKIYTMSEIERHNTRKSNWIVIKGHVYDTTSFLSNHPGGANSILNHAGTDCTDDFESIHSVAAWSALENFYIGDVAVDGGDNTGGSGGSAVEPILSNAGGMIMTTNRKGGTGTGTGTGGVEDQVRVDEHGHIIALGKNKYVPFPLQERIQLSHDTILVRFGLPTKEHVLGLPLGQHILLQATINKASVARSYTPTSTNLQQGYFDLVVKVYAANTNPAFPEGGKMSQYLNNMNIGDTINVKGPTGHVTYLGRGNIKVGQIKHSVQNFVMIAAGTGITPMYQILSAIIRDVSDTTKCHLLFANRTEYDILLMNELDSLSARHPDRFYVYHILSRPQDPVAWSETAHFSGYVCADVLQKIFPKGGKHSHNMALLCGPKGFTEDTCPASLKEIGYSDASIVTF